MLRRLLIGPAIVLGMMLTGCGLAGGPTVVRYDKGQAVRMTEAPKDATYGLYSSSDRTPEVTFHLNKGEQIGFKEGSNGAIVAVAGQHEQPITPSMTRGSYYWKEVKD